MDNLEYLTVSIVILRPELAKIQDLDWDRYQRDGKIRDQDWDPEEKKNREQNETKTSLTRPRLTPVSWDWDQSHETRSRPRVSPSSALWLRKALADAKLDTTPHLKACNKTDTNVPGAPGVTVQLGRISFTHNSVTTTQQETALSSTELSSVIRPYLCTEDLSPIVLHNMVLLYHRK